MAARVFYTNAAVTLTYIQYSAKTDALFFIFTSAPYPFHPPSLGHGGSVNPKVQRHS